MPDAQILHRGTAPIYGDDSTSVLPVIQRHVFRVQLTQASCGVAPDDIALDIIHSEI